MWELAGYELVALDGVLYRDLFERQVFTVEEANEMASVITPAEPAWAIRPAYRFVKEKTS